MDDVVKATLLDQFRCYLDGIDEAPPNRLRREVQRQTCSRSSSNWRRCATRSAPNPGW